MTRQHSNSASSDSSNKSAQSYSSSKTYETDITTYSQQSFHAKSSKEAPTHTTADEAVSPRSSVQTYASTINLKAEEVQVPRGPQPSARHQCYQPDFSPATAGEFAAVYPSTRRLLIQHDETTEDGNMNVHVDTEVTTTSGRRKKLSLFHLRMKDLAERDFSIRRYGRDSGRAVASCHKHYIRSAPSLRRSRTQSSALSISGSESELESSHEKSDAHRHHRADSGYASTRSDDDDEDADEDDLEILERLNLMTAAADQIVSQPTDAVKIEFSNYAHVLMDKSQQKDKPGYEFEYWGDSYFWKREKQVDGGETIYCFDLMRISDGQKLAVIMPDALSPEEGKWEAKQGGWIPASSMRLLNGSMSSDLADVIMTTGLIALTDDSMRRQLLDGDSSE